MSWHPGRRVSEQGDYSEVREPCMLEWWDIISSDTVLFLSCGEVSPRRALSSVADEITLEAAGQQAMPTHGPDVIFCAKEA